MQLYTQYIDILYCAVFISEDFVVKDIRKDALVFLSKIFRKEIADIHDRSVVFTGEPSSALKETAARRCMVGSRGVGMEELPEEAGRKVQSCKDFTAHCVRVCVSGESVVVSVIRCSFCTRCSANKGEIGRSSMALLHRLSNFILSVETTDECQGRRESGADYRSPSMRTRCE